jgi:hypothetical protein
VVPQTTTRTVEVPFNIDRIVEVPFEREVIREIEVERPVYQEVCVEPVPQPVTRCVVRQPVCMPCERPAPVAVRPRAVCDRPVCDPCRPSSGDYRPKGTSTLPRNWGI